MGFSFNPYLCFTCRLCRGQFSTLDKLLEHKLESHLGECLKIKRIVFEEKLLDHELDAPYDSCKQKLVPDCSPSSIPLDHHHQNVIISNSNTITPSTKTASPVQSRFQNPFVSLTRLTAQELDSALGKHKGVKVESTSTSTNDISTTNFVKVDPYRIASSNEIENLEIEVAEEWKPSNPLDLGLGLGLGLSPHSHLNFILIPSPSSNENEFQSPLNTPIYDPLEITNPRPIKEETDCDLKPALITIPTPTPTAIPVPKRKSKRKRGLRLKPRLFRCQICEYDFRSSRCLSRHMTFHSENRPLHKCSQCNREYTSKRELVLHTREKHSGKMTVATKKQPKPEPEPEPKKQKQKAYFCKICRHRFAYKAGLNKHMFWKHMEERPLLECDEPSTITHDDALNSNSNSVRGQIKIEGQDQSPEQIEDLNENDPGQLETIDHQLIGALISTDCNSSGSSSCDIRSPVPVPVPVKRKFEGKPKPNFYSCESCHARLSTSYGLKNHMRSTHSEERPFECTHEGCDASFKIRASLKRHQRTHDVRKRYLPSISKQLLCAFCGKAFSTKLPLERHEKRHLGVKSFKCPAENCPSTFYYRNSLNAHKREKHFRELKLRHFICHACGIAFGLSYHLKHHIRIHHSDEKPLKCTVEGCERRFKIKVYLKSHLRTHTKRNEKKEREAKQKDLEVNADLNLNAEETVEEEIVGIENEDA